jgi:nicotinate-nucleotide adenylyltransferase
LKLAVHAFSELNLDKIIFVPSFHTPFKEKEKLIPGKLRLRLLRAALKEYPHFSVSDCEIKRGGASFTVDTLKFFEKKFGDGATLFFLTGADVLKGLSRWKSPEKVLKLSRFVVATRPGSSFKETHWPILRMPFDAEDISASDIRKRLKEKRDIRSLVPGRTADMLLAQRTFQRSAGFSLPNFDANKTNKNNHQPDQQKPSQTNQEVLKSKRSIK